MFASVNERVLWSSDDVGLGTNDGIGIAWSNVE